MIVLVSSFLWTLVVRTYFGSVMSIDEDDCQRWYCSINVKVGRVRLCAKDQYEHILILAVILHGNWTIHVGRTWCRHAVPYMAMTLTLESKFSVVQCGLDVVLPELRGAGLSEKRAVSLFDNYIGVNPAIASRFFILAPPPPYLAFIGGHHRGVRDGGLNPRRFRLLHARPHHC
jgi:hypothetical protein